MIHCLKMQNVRWYWQEVQMNMSLDSPCKPRNMIYLHEWHHFYRLCMEPMSNAGVKSRITNCNNHSNIFKPATLIMVLLCLCGPSFQLHIGLAWVSPCIVNFFPHHSLILISLADCTAKDWVYSSWFLSMTYERKQNLSFYSLLPCMGWNKLKVLTVSIKELMKTGCLCMADLDWTSQDHINTCWAPM